MTTQLLEREPNCCSNPAQSALQVALCLLNGTITVYTTSLLLCRRAYQKGKARM